jgi:nucleotide-binding universal stress UspA family protein
MNIFGVTPVLDALQRLFPSKENPSTAAPSLPLKHYHTLLLPLLTDACAENLAALASRFPQVQKVVLCYLIPVPRALPLEGALPEEEEAASRVLGEMATRLRTQGFDVQTQVRRARVPLEEVLKVIREVGADLILVARDSPDFLENEQPFAQPLSQKAPCEVILLHQV